MTTKTTDLGQGWFAHQTKDDDLETMIISGNGITIGLSQDSVTRLRAIFAEAEENAPDFHPDRPDAVKQREFRANQRKDRR